MKFKTFVLYYITNIAAIWMCKAFLSGFKLSGAPTVFLLAFVLLVGLALNEWINTKLNSNKGLMFFIIGILLMFFVIYFASFLLPYFEVTGGSLDPLKIGFLQTPFIRSADQILTLMLGSFLVITVTSIARWAGAEK